MYFSISSWNSFLRRLRYWFSLARLCCVESRRAMCTLGLGRVSCVSTESRSCLLRDWRRASWSDADVNRKGNRVRNFTQSDRLGQKYWHLCKCEQVMKINLYSWSFLSFVKKKNHTKNFYQNKIIKHVGEGWDWSLSSH